MTLILGQLIDGTYVDSICEEINEKLQLEGTISIALITKEYDLPSEFIQEEVIKRLGSIIEGFQDENDPKIILTPSYVMRNRAKVRGALSAITVPTAISAILQRHKIQVRVARLYISILISNLRRYTIFRSKCSLCWRMSS